MWIYIVAAIVLLILGLVVIGLTKPAAMRLEREALIVGEQAAVFRTISRFTTWQHWSPWKDVDPNVVITYGGSEGAVGATYHWRGNKQAGEGTMTITALQPSSEIAISLAFVKPFPGVNQTTFVLSPEGNATRVRWIMTGPRPLLVRIMTIFFDFDAMLAKDFDKGLAQLNALALAGKLA